MHASESESNREYREKGKQFKMEKGVNVVQVSKMEDPNEASSCHILRILIRATVWLRV